ncbi:MAG: zf-HC2 domain-containing protein [Gemmatimonadaceae bacterium]|nr:zf-HC2 domain-containing protein [Gemmatimonadaceae bacterium]
MDCRTFRQLHGLWMDGGLAPRHAERLLAHVGDCEGCAHFDAMVRRALLVARNAAPVSCSADFSARLRARLAEERAREFVPRDMTPLPSHAGVPRFAPSWRVAAAAAIVVGGAAFTMRGGTATDPRAAATFDSAGLGGAGASWTAVTGAAPATLLPPPATAAMPAAPLWPSATMAARAARRFADAEFGATPVRAVVQAH